MKEKIQAFLMENRVVILFTLVTIGAFYASGMSTPMFFNEMFTRFGRNAFIVLSLLIPVVAGLGLNFGIVLGAMAGQIAIFLVVLWGGSGFLGLMSIFAVATPIAILFGFLVGKMFNSMKGSEMVAGMVANLFANGFYQFFFLFIMGGLIPVANERLTTHTGVGILNAINLGDSPIYMRQVLDNVPMLNILDVAFPTTAVIVAIMFIIKKVRKEKIYLLGSGGMIKPVCLVVGLGLAYIASFIIEPFHYFLYQNRLNGLLAADIGLGVMAIYMVVRLLFDKFMFKKPIKQYIINLIIIGIAYSITLIPAIARGLDNVSIPVLTYLIIGALCIFINWFLKTRLGQNMRTVGQNRNVATSAGINVDKTRIIAMIFSTVLAAYGQIIALQNFGMMNTYGSHEFVALYAIAALLVGGASVSRATVKNALMGVFLFHAFFILAPLAGSRLMGSALIGEYVRMVVANGVIALALIMYAWKRVVKKKEA